MSSNLTVSATAHADCPGKRMNDSNRLADKIDQFQGSMLAMECLLNALAESLTSDQRLVVKALFASESAAFRAALMSSTAPEATVDAFERDVERAVRLFSNPAT